MWKFIYARIVEYDEDNNPVVELMDNQGDVNIGAEMVERESQLYPVSLLVNRCRPLIGAESQTQDTTCIQGLGFVVNTK